MDYLFLLLVFAALVFLVFRYLQKQKNKDDVNLELIFAMSIIGLLIINQCLLLVNSTSVNVIEDSKEVVNEKDKHGSLIFKAKGEERSFKAGEDFPPGRYMITSSDKEAVIFIRNSENTKIVSEVIGSSKDSLSSYTITMEKDWRIVPIMGTEIELTPLYETNFTLSTGYWKVGKDIQVKDGVYNISFNDGNGLVTIFDEKLNEVTKVNYADKNLSKLPIKEGYTIKITGSNTVSFSPTTR